MPIRPENRERYSPNWKEIRGEILQRAGNKCEFCGVENHTLRLNPKTGKEAKIVLTIAHLDHTPENNDPENLRALCQRCHNQHDAQHRAETRKARAGQKQEQEPEPVAIFDEPEARTFHRFTCPNRGYEGSCLELSGRTAQGHALVACREDAPCSRLKEYDEHGLEEYADPEERIMWECRRYEIAKEVLPAMMHAWCGNPEAAARESVKCADALIAELKGGNQ